MPDVDEFGIPKKKQSPTQEVDEFGIPRKKKVGTEPTLESPKPSQSGGQKSGSDWFSSLPTFTQEDAESVKQGVPVPGTVRPSAPKKPKSQYQVTREEIKKKNGPLAAKLYDVQVTGEQTANAVAQGTLNVGADFFDFIGMVSNKIDDAQNNVPLFGKQVAGEDKKQDDYATTKWAKSIREFANDIAPLDPDFQDNVIVQLAQTAPAMAGAMASGSLAGSALIFGTTSGGAEFRQAYDRFDDYKNLSKEEVINKYAQKPEDVEVISKHVDEVKKSNQSPEELAFSTGLINSAIGIKFYIPFFVFGVIFVKRFSPTHTAHTVNSLIGCFYLTRKFFEFNTIYEIVQRFIGCCSVWVFFYNLTCPILHGIDFV